MGSSAFEPVVLADVRSVKNKINLSGLTGDIISVGDVIRYEPTTDVYIRAKADSDAGANFVGVVESISGTDFTIVYSGEISISDTVMSAIAGYTGAQVFYLSDTNAGKLTTTAPSNPGSIIKPVIITRGTVQDAGGVVDGIVVNSTGTRISGDSSVDLSDIQPVGSVLAFAGNTSDIPTGWDICDGGFLGVTAYADLYSALNDGQIYGFVQNLTLNLVANSGSGRLSSSNIEGSKFYITRLGATESIECTVLSGTVNATGSQVTDANVFVNPIYASGVNEGYYHDTALVTGDSGRFYLSDGTPLNVQYSVASPTKTLFKKPDIRSRFIVGDSRSMTGAESTAFSSYTVGNYGGEEFHTLLTEELPIHKHTIGVTASISGNLSTSHNLTTDVAGTHRHSLVGREAGGLNTINASNALSNPPAYEGYTIRPRDLFGSGNWQYVLALVQDEARVGKSSAAGSHSHGITGAINVSAQGMTPVVTATVENTGADIPHNNVPQHVVMYWIIKTRKDSYAKIVKLGPSGGGAVIAKNTPKKWARMSTPGAGATIDAYYGDWVVSRVGNGNYIFTHNIVNELGATSGTKYIVEATVTKNTGATAMPVACPYGYTGITFGMHVFDIVGATLSDNFTYLNITLYGGGTAL